VHAELTSAIINSGDGKEMKSAHFMCAIDCRAYRKLVHMKALKSATTFMNYSGTDATANQIKSLYRIPDLSRMNEFKPVP